MRKTHPESSWQAQWSDAIRRASASPETLDLLFLTISQRPDWKDETTRALWKFVEFGNQAADALDKLEAHYREAGDDGGLLKVVSAKLDRSPGDVTLRSEFARLCLLRRVQVGEERRIAAECLREDPDSPDAVVTQAYALATVGRHEGAITLMRSLPAVQRDKPRPAAYMAIILSMAGRGTEAAAYLGHAQSGRLLNAERELLGL